MLTSDISLPFYNISGNLFFNWALILSLYACNSGESFLDLIPLDFNNPSTNSSIFPSIFFCFSIISVAFSIATFLSGEISYDILFSA